MWYSQLKNTLLALIEQLKDHVAHNHFARATIISGGAHLAVLIVWGASGLIYRIGNPISIRTTASIKFLQFNKPQNTLQGSSPHPSRKTAAQQKKIVRQAPKKISSKKIKAETVTPKKPTFKKTFSAKKTAQKKEKKTENKNVTEPESTPEPAQEPTASPDIPDSFSLNSADTESSDILLAVGNAVRSVWAPPVASENLTCALTVALSDRGKVKKITFVTRSGSIAFDLMAQKAAATAAYPRIIWNRTFTLTF